MTRFLKAALCLFVLCLSTLPALAQGRSIIVLDGSGSMWGQIDGRAKLEIAREALAEVLGGLPPETELGLIAYGHRTQGACDDIELIVPPGAGTAAAISDAAQNLQFVGKTPLTDAVRQAAVELRSSEEKATVILITDGIETCNADPCALGVELEASGVDFTAHVVGFGLSDEDGAKVACLAENTGGVYIQASDAGTLRDALQTTVVVVEPTPVPEPAPEPEPAALEYNFAPLMVLSEGGDVVPDVGQAWELYQSAAGGQRGEYLTTEYGKPEITIAPGTYRLVARVGLVEVEQEVVITDADLAAPIVVMNAGTITVRPRGSEGGPVETSAAVQLTNAAGVDSTSYGEWTTVFPAGDVRISVKVGEATVSQDAELAPGQVLDLDIVAGAGLAAVDAYYVEGMIMDTTQHAVEIAAAAKAIDGSRASITTSYGPGQQFTLAPGDYVAIVTQGAASAEVSFTVKVGERVDVPVILNAGVLAVTATGANSIEVLDAKVDISGNRVSRDYQYTENLNLVAPGGDYVLLITRGETVVEATATVTPGERTEITVP
jgi:Ca-activated chloride channel homolog